MRKPKYRPIIDVLCFGYLVFFDYWSTQKQHPNCIVLNWSQSEASACFAHLYSLLLLDFLKLSLRTLLEEKLVKDAQIQTALYLFLCVFFFFCLIRYWNAEAGECDLRIARASCWRTRPRLRDIDVAALILLL